MEFTLRLCCADENSFTIVKKVNQIVISYYDTEAGAFSIGVFANYLEADINQDGGNIEIDYALEIDGNVIGQNEIAISFEYIEK